MKLVKSCPEWLVIFHGSYSQRKTDSPAAPDKSDNQFFGIWRFDGRVGLNFHQ